MKRSKLFIAILFLMGVGFSCTDTSKYPVPFDQLNTSNGGILKQIAQTSITFNKFDVPGSKYEVILEANDRDRGKLFTKVDLFVGFSDRTPANGNATKAEKVLPIKSYPNSAFTADPTTKLPRLTISVTETEVLAFLGLLSTDLEGADQFVFRQAMSFPDGKVFSTNNVNSSISNSGGVFKSPFGNVVAVVCPSDLGGLITWTTVVTAAVVPIAPCLVPPGYVSGTSLFTVTAPGKYSIPDATFGQYKCAWNDNPAAGTKLEDACGLLSITGSDQYGLLYSWIIFSNNGTQLIIKWSNDYGDKGTTTMTRVGGWPLTIHF